MALDLDSSLFQIQVNKWSLSRMFARCINAGVDARSFPSMRTSAPPTRVIPRSGAKPSYRPSRRLHRICRSTRPQRHAAKRIEHGQPFWRLVEAEITGLWGGREDGRKERGIGGRSDYEIVLYKIVRWFSHGKGKGLKTIYCTVNALTRQGLESVFRYWGNVVSVCK